MKKNNELIAEFMGMQQGHPDKEESRWKNDWFEKLIVDGNEFEAGSRHTYLHFDTSWDWLMPVVDKIKSVTQEPEELDTLRDTLWWGSKEDIFNEVVDYIKRINSGEIETAE